MSERNAQLWLMLGWLSIAAISGGLMGLATSNDTPTPPPATVTVTVTPTAWTEPYGGCKEAARYPRSTGYAECKQHGLLP